jgi:hypothetical protein
MMKAFWQGFIEAFHLAYVICIVPAAYCLLFLKDKIVDFWYFIVNFSLQSIAYLQDRWNSRKK